MKKDHAKKRYIGKIIVAFLFGAAIMAFIRYISYGGMNSGTQVNNEDQKENESMLMISGHNGHVAKKSTYTTFMGEELFEKYGDDYFVIGTDFYKTECNLPGKNGKRITRKFYSADPLANTAYALGMDMTYLDFDKLQKLEKIKKTINQSMLMGSLGEGYSFLNMILPNSYRINDVPAELYDGMIIVINATPTDIKH